MKRLITNYTFNAATRQVTFTDYTSIALEGVLLVTNVTDNIIIYNFADSTKGGTVSTNVLTLAYNTTSMSNTDDLQIFYDDGATNTTTISDRAGSYASIRETGSTTTHSINVAIVGSTGEHITSFGGGVQYSAGASNGSPTGTVALGFDGVIIRPLRVGSSGNLQVDIASNVTIGGSVFAVQSGNWNLNDITGVISLPTGAATAANQLLGNSLLSNINSKTVTVDTSNVTIVGFPSNVAFNLGQYAGAGIGPSNGVHVRPGTSALFQVDGDVSLKAGSNTVGNVGIVGTINSGVTAFHLISGNSTNPTVIKSSAGALTGYYIHNNTNFFRKVAFHNVATTPTAGTSVYWAITLGPNFPANLSFNPPLAFSSGIAITTTAGISDGDATGVSTLDLNINLSYL